MNDCWMILIALVFAVLALGCGSAVQTHTTAIRVASGTHAVGGAVFDEAFEQSIERIVEQTEGQPREVRVAAVHAERERWEPGAAALDAAREVIGGWLDTIEAIEAGAENLWSRIPLLVGRLVRLWGDAVRIARGLGVELPELPSQVTSLVGALGGP